MSDYMIINGKQYPIHNLTMTLVGGRMSLDARYIMPSSWKGSLEKQRQEPSAVRAQELRQELIDFAKTGAPPALVENVTHRLDPAEIELALRAREDAFNESSLPPGYVPLAPRELYGDDMWPPKSQRPDTWFKGCTDETARHVPRMFEQRPYDAESADIAALRRQAVMRVREAGIFEPPKRARPASLNDFARQVHADNAHWWHDPATGNKLDRNMGEMLMLVVSEIAECMEGERKNLMDDHLPHRKMAEVELADAVIRIADIMGSMLASGTGRVLELKVEWKRMSDPTPENKGQALLRICRKVDNVNITPSTRNRLYRLALAVAEIESYAEKHGYDLWGAVAEKREYNKHRADHKPEARLAPNGKKF